MNIGMNIGMNTAKIARWTMALPALALGFSAPAMAHRVVHINGTLYVIICEPGGQAFTFNGSQSGAGDVSGLLCPGMATNGSTGTETGTVFVEAQSAELAIKTKGLPVQRTTAHEAAHTVQQRQGAAGGTRKDCPSGTHWYEPAKACVANGGHPSE